MRTLTHVLAAFGFIALLLAGAPGHAQGDDHLESALPERYSVTMKAANAAYNNGDYKQAANGYIRSIQAAPRRAEAYRNLARSYFWLGKYAAAVAYYDFYVQLAPDADDVQQVQSERRLAASRSGDAIYTMPESQQMARRALEQQLESGRAYTAGGGGAWGLYNSLLRTNYARPDVANFQRRLVRKLLEEFDGMLVAEAGQPVPRLDLEGWQLQLDRLQAARQLTEDEGLLEIADSRSTVAEAGIALLTGNRDEAVTLIGGAIERNPDLGFLHWFRVVALVEANQNERALEAVGELGRQLAAANAPSSHIEYASVLRANILRRLGRHEDAADLYLEILE
jgi:tetratricopeptide (TPR) repeat protein